jgi:uncharacterized protein (DUF305 family)
MHKRCRFAAIVLGAVMALPMVTIVASTPAYAQSQQQSQQNMGTAMDCSQAHTMMGDSMKTMNSDMDQSKMTGDVDHDFMVSMMAQQKAMAAMAKIEAQCGKNPQAKSMAQTVMRSSSADIDQLNRLLRRSTSQ